jgi:transcriptional regulator with XRE-family HTH domain
METHETETHETELAKAAEVEAARLMQLLARLVRLSKKSMRTLGAELGLGSSMISKILTGAVRPQVSYILMLSGAIGLTPEEFFSLAYRLKKRSTNPLVKALMETEGADDAEETEQRMSRELDQVVEAAVRRALQRLVTGGPEPKSKAE